VIRKGLFGQIRQLKEGFPNNGDTQWLQRVAVTPDGLQAVSAGVNGLRTWDLEAGKPLLVFDERSNYRALAVSADGKRAIAGDVSKLFVRVYDLKTGKPVRELIRGGHPGIVWGAALSADGKRAVTGGASPLAPSLRVWEVETGKELRRFVGV